MYLAMALCTLSLCLPSISRQRACSTAILCRKSAGSMSASKFGCWAVGIVMVEAVAKMNSVTISVGIKLDALFSNSFRSAPSKD